MHEQIERPKKPEGRSCMSASYDNWEYRLEKGGEEFTRRLEEPPTRPTPKER